MYELHFSDEAKLDIAKLKQSEPKSYAKATKLLIELQEHPTTGTGHPEKLSGNRVGQWSRRISAKHRLVYEIHDMEIFVWILSAWGHYDDK